MRRSKNSWRSWCGLSARTTLEIGIFTGYSSLAVALALLADGTIVACDVSEEFTAIARRYWRAAEVEQKIELHSPPLRQHWIAYSQKAKRSASTSRSSTPTR